MRQKIKPDIIRDILLLQLQELLMRKEIKDGGINLIGGRRSGYN